LSRCPQRLSICIVMSRMRRPQSARVPTKLSLRSTANCMALLTDKCRDLEAARLPLVWSMAPALLDEPGVGVLLAVQILVSWSHPGRCRDEAASARLGGVAPLEDTSGQTQTRHRLSRAATASSTEPCTPSSWPAPRSTHDQGRHRSAQQRGQDQARGHALPQALLRPPPLATSGGHSRNHLTPIGAPPSRRCHRTKLRDPSTPSGRCSSATARPSSTGAGCLGRHAK
jgi:hypothetical protein